MVVGFGGFQESLSLKHGSAKFIKQTSISNYLYGLSKDVYGEIHEATLCLCL